jgi:hypothetical protein
MLKLLLRFYKITNFLLESWWGFNLRGAFMLSDAKSDKYNEIVKAYLAKNNISSEKVKYINCNDTSALIEFNDAKVAEFFKNIVEADEKNLFDTQPRFPTITGSACLVYGTALILFYSLMCSALLPQISTSNQTIFSQPLQASSSALSSESSSTPSNASASSALSSNDLRTADLKVFF